MSTILNIERQLIPNDVIVILSSIYTWIGKNYKFAEKTKSDYEKIVDQTIERDTFFLAYILGLEITDHRMRLIITKNSTPRNNEERVLLNLKETLTSIQRNYKNLRFQSNDILNIINYIYSHLDPIRFSKVDSERKSLLQSQSLESKRLVLDQINEAVELYVNKEAYEKITLYLNYFVDFYNIEPFTNFNFTASLVLLYLLIFKADLEAFKYISFFELLLENYDMFQREIKDASFNWNDGFSKTTNFIKFMNNLIISGYERAAEVIENYKFDSNLNKGDNIGNTINKLPDIFSKKDIRMIHPYVSESTINRALIKFRDEGRIKPLGKGRSAKWVKIYRGYNYEKD